MSSAECPKCDDDRSRAKRFCGRSRYTLFLPHNTARDEKYLDTMQGGEKRCELTQYHGSKHL